MIRLATLEDLSIIKNIYAYARKFMVSTGNPNQWGNRYPSEELLIDDISKNELYVCYDEKEIYAVFVFFIHVDETYNYIEGKWLNNDDYGVIHRIASIGSKKGIFSEVFDYVTNFVDNIRIDTHRDNIVMHNVLNKNGFIECGTIYLKNGSERLAYHFFKNGE